MLGLKELLETTGNMLTKQKVVLEWRFSWACVGTVLAEVGCACEVSVIKAGTPPENLEGSFTCQSLCWFSVIFSSMFWTAGFENI